MKTSYKKNAPIKWTGYLIQNHSTNSVREKEVEKEILPTINEIVKYLNSFTIVEKGN